MQAAGVTHLHYSTMELDYSPEEHIAAIRDFAEQSGVGR